MARINPPPELCDPSEAEHVCELLAQHHARVAALADAGDHAGVIRELQQGRPNLSALAAGVAGFAERLPPDDARRPACGRLLDAARTDDAELLRGAWLGWIAVCGAAGLYHDAPRQSKLQRSRRSAGVTVERIREFIARERAQTGRVPKKMAVADAFGVDESTITRVLTAARTTWREVARTTTVQTVVRPDPP